MELLIVFILGAIFGAMTVFIIYWLRHKEAKSLAQELISQTEDHRTEQLETLINKIKDSFGALSLEALSKNTGEFLKLANETLSRQTQMGEKDLEGKKKLIDKTLVDMKGDLSKLQDLVTNLEKDREKKFGELSSQLKLTAEQTGKLQETTSQLHSALASSKARGQWGERMAEDVLTLAGFVEGINFRKQKALETAGTIPDYTFFLPHNLIVNMDVKFPLDNYMRYLDADNDTEQEKFKSQFIRDVKNRIKEVTTREYINPEENTVDYVIVFIPNDQVYAFINESDNSVLDDALKNKVILCSPITLYAILAVIRQGVDNFNLEKTASQILSLLGTFNKQWELFVKSMEKMGQRIQDAQEEFNSLTTTRRNQLERSLKQIEELRQQKQIPESTNPPADSIDKAKRKTKPQIPQINTDI
jgi:DNA recombination protein RmuC